METYLNHTCKVCQGPLMTMDEYYKLPPCHEFILICPIHPAELIWDLPEEDLLELEDD